MNWKKHRRERRIWRFWWNEPHSNFPHSASCISIHKKERLSNLEPPKTKQENRPQKETPLEPANGIGHAWTGNQGAGPCVRKLAQFRFTVLTLTQSGIGINLPKMSTSNPRCWAMSNEQSFPKFVGAHIHLNNRNWVIQRKREFRPPKHPPTPVAWIAPEFSCRACGMQHFKLYTSLCLRCRYPKISSFCHHSWCFGKFFRMCISSGPPA